MQKEVKQLDDQINHLHKSSLGYYFKQVEIKAKLKEYMEQLQDLENGLKYEEVEKTIGILLIYSQEMTKKINDLTAIIDDKKREKELKQNVTLNREIWRNVTENVMIDRKQIEDIDIRRLFIPLVNYISVDEELNLAYQLRIDNKRRKIQKGHRPLPY